MDSEEKETLCVCGGGSLTAAIIFMIIALCLYFPGYQQRVEWNDDLVDTTCEWSSNHVQKSSCSYQCNCYETCTTVVRQRDDGSTYTTEDCNTYCQTCWRDCWRLSCTFKYMIQSTETYATQGRNKGTVYSSDANAEQAVKASCPIGGQWSCKYHGMEPQTVVDSEYDEEGFFIAAMFFFGLLGAAGLWLLVTIAIFAYYYARAEGRGSSDDNYSYKPNSYSSPSWPYVGGYEMPTYSYPPKAPRSPVYPSYSGSISDDELSNDDWLERKSPDLSTSAASDSSNLYPTIALSSNTRRQRKRPLNRSMISVGVGGRNRRGINRPSYTGRIGSSSSRRYISGGGSGDRILSVTTTTRPVGGLGFSTHRVREGSHPYGFF